MFAAWVWFVDWGWLFCMIAIGIYCVWWLVKHWSQATWIERLCVMAMIVLVFHVWEEWVIPGGFHWIYNAESMGQPYQDRYPMSRLTDMITNFGGELLGLVILLRFHFRNEAGIAIGLFSLFEAIIHVYLAFHSLDLFGQYGQTAFYAPGLVTALLGFLPVGIGLMVCVIRNKPKLREWLVGLFCLVVVSQLFVSLPESLLKSTDNPYYWTDHGYYNQFIEAEEADYANQD